MVPQYNNFFVSKLKVFSRKDGAYLDCIVKLGFRKIIKRFPESHFKEMDQEGQLKKKQIYISFPLDSAAVIFLLHS